MYSNGAAFLVLGLVVFWLGVLTYLLWQVRSFLQKLFPEDQGSFKKKLDEVLSEVKYVHDFRAVNLKNLQKISLKRFNPYQDTGGDQSFTVALLDGKDNGLVVTSLHARGGTRVFAKEIKNGKADGVKLSEEEELAVKEALK